MSSESSGWKTIEKMKDEDRPRLDNYPELAKWIYGCNRARCAFQLPNGNHLVEGWLLGDKVVIFQFYDKKHGWEVYLPMQTIKSEETLTELATFCGLTEKDWEE